MKKRVKLGNYEAFIVDNIKSIGQIQYRYLLFLYDNKDKHLPIFFVSAEQNMLSIQSNSPSYFFCAFEEKGHVNYGLDETIGDIDFFEKKAIELANNKYNH